MSSSEEESQRHSSHKHRHKKRKHSHHSHKHKKDRDYTRDISESPDGDSKSKKHKKDKRHRRGSEEGGYRADIDKERDKNREQDRSRVRDVDRMDNVDKERDKDDYRRKDRNSDRDMDSDGDRYKYRGGDREGKKDGDNGRYRDKGRDRDLDKDKDRSRGLDRESDSRRNRGRSKERDRSKRAEDNRGSEHHGKRKRSDSEEEVSTRYHVQQDDASTNKREETQRGSRSDKVEDLWGKRAGSGSGSEKEEEDEEEVPVYDVNWENYRIVLSKIFFRDEDLIQRGTETYHGFWDFLKKYLVFQRKRASKPNKDNQKPRVSDKTTGDSDLGIPCHYESRYRINLGLPPRDALNVIRFERYRPGVEPLTPKRVKQFKEIYLHYLDFLQKQKFNKLVKIRTDQQNLPIFQYKQAIVDTVRQHQVVVVAGDTGCGKSTQVPQYLLEAGFQQVACTQPRRIACISLAKRVAHETLNEYGSQVAYQVRFEKTKTQITKILFLTEGLLLRQMTNDPLLEKYNVIVIDEVHERHIHTDFLLGVVKCLLQQRADLKLVLMSATININLFSDYFDKAPVVKVPGRLYPIELQYLPITEEDKSGKTQRLDPGPYIRVLQRIEHKYPGTERGDVLMFLSGLTEIMAVVEAVQAYAEQTKRWIVLPLHSALSVSEQDKVFDFPPEGVRKCIVSTNIAETSVTIDGVRFVVDSGKVKEMSYDSQCKMQRLQEFWISRASSEQRKGRAGRTGPGVCYRLYGETEYNDLQPYSTPEIRRVPLDSLVLQMVSMGLNDARRFPFIEPPATESLETSISFLIEQNALTNGEVLTPIGDMLSQLPVNVVIGKMLIMGSLFHMIEPVLSIAAALSVQSPFTARAHSDSEAMNARKPLESDHGDPFTLLNAFDEWVQVKADHRDNSRKWCRRRGLEEQRFYEMTRLKTQFHDILKDHGLLPARPQGKPAATSYERQRQHADKRKLREMKRDQQRTRNKRKVLKLDDDYKISGDEDDGENDLDANIRDLEFRLTHDLDALQDRSTESQGFTLRQVTLLKIILCSGLYPQVALADDCPDAAGDPMYHTKSKPFVTVHPTSIFYTKSEVLELSEHDIKPAPGGDRDADRRYPHSNKHQLLAYVSLLETTKPYLTGLMRVPALQTLALYATAIDTNADCTRLVFDSWLDVRFGSGEEATESGELVLSSAVQLRTTWTLLVQAKLDAHKEEKEKETEGAQTAVSDRVRRLERTVAEKLTEFLYCDVSCSIRRVYAADLAHLYVGPVTTDTESTAGKVLSGLCKDAAPHPTKGGLKVNDYLTFNCLQDYADAYSSYMQKHWTCPKCEEQFVVTVIERIQHEQDCAQRDTDKQESKDSDPKAGLKNDGKDSLRKPYHCVNCNQTLMLTVTEILKHKKQCTAS